MVGVPTSSPTWSMPSWWRLLDRLVEDSSSMASTSSAGRPTSASAAGDQLRGRSRCFSWWMRVPIAVYSGQQHLVAVLLGRGDSDAHRAPGGLEHLAVVVRDVLVLVEVAQAHHVPLHLDVADLLDLEDPAGGDPGEGAQGVEPEVSGGLVHVWHNQLEGPDIPPSQSAGVVVSPRRRRTAPRASSRTRPAG